MSTYMTNHRKINTDSSVFLDTVRITAAIVVVADHSYMIWSTDYNMIRKLNNVAHSAVVVFFVLSGYLIAYTTTINNRGIKQYFVARLSRLYSILFPSLIITLSIELLLRIFYPSVISQYLRGSSVIRYMLSLTMCNEVGTLSAAPQINAPLWSLSYEFWYYALFGIFFYKVIKNKYVTLLICLFFIGFIPKVLLLMPIWLFGFVAYKINWAMPGTILSWPMVTGIGLLTLLCMNTLPGYPLNLGLKPLYFSGNFIGDWATGLVVALSLTFLPLSNNTISPTWASKLRLLGDTSFPLYVLHFPILLLLKALTQVFFTGYVQMIFSVITMIISCIFIGIFLESKRKTWILLLDRLLKSNVANRAYKKIQTSLSVN